MEFENKKKWYKTHTHKYIAVDEKIIISMHNTIAEQYVQPVPNIKNVDTLNW